MKTFIFFVLATVLIAGGIFLWLNPSLLSGIFGGASAPEPAAPLAPAAPVQQTYASSTLGISLRYPGEFRIADHEYLFSDTKTIPGGVKFVVSASLATGTNLSPDSYLAIEQLPRASSCTGDIYIRDNVTATARTEGGVNYSLASTTDAAAGNRYEEIVYAFADSKPCTAVRYFIHSTVLENYPAGTVREFDRAALLGTFDEIRRSIRFGTAAAPSTAPAATSTAQ